MATPTNHWKVGLFDVMGFVMALCALVYLGVEGLRKNHVRYHTYIDEPVQGLDVGSPIQFRGVKVGQVAEIGIAPDRRRVHVVCALFTRNLSALGLAVGDGDEMRMAVPPEMRIQLVVQGITGLKALQIDFFDPAATPAPALPFPVPPTYIPSAPSLLTKLGHSVNDAVDRVPEIADALLRVASRADRLIETLERAELAQDADGTLARADQAFASLQKAIDHAAFPALSAQAQRALADFETTVQRANAVLARLDGKDGILASVHRTSNALGDAVSTSPPLAEEMVATLREVQEAAASFRRFTDALERNPEMLLKGRGERQ